MKAFADLYSALDETNATSEKVKALVAYFQTAPASDAAWAVHFLSGRRPKRLVGGRKLYDWAAGEADIPGWLFEESYEAVGDLAETISLLLPEFGSGVDRPLAWWVEEQLLPLRNEDESVQRNRLIQTWHQLGGRQRYVWNKLITGSFRVGVSQQLLVRALSQVSGVAETVLAHRLMGSWNPTADFLTSVLQPDATDTDESRPYPFALAHPLEQPVEELGVRTEWQVEWKWDGIRSQLIRRHGRTWIWSRGEELLSGRFPEIEASSALLPDGTVLDGEIMPWKNGPLSFALLQRRIGRKTVSQKLLTAIPVVLLAFDVLEVGGKDVREESLASRRSQLERLLTPLTPRSAFELSPLVPGAVWSDVAEARLGARASETEGLMLKRLSSSYGVGRKRGDWWKWKVAPLTIDAVLIYAQPGTGKRAGLFSDYTFGVWQGDQLVPFAKAYSGLTDVEIRKVDTFIRRNTLARYGPVRTVKPELVFELAFERILPSSRHKSGVAVRFPRILRWRHDKQPPDADRLETLHALITSPEP